MMKRQRCLHCRGLFDVQKARREKYCSPACRIAARPGADNWAPTPKSAFRSVGPPSTSTL